MLAEQLFELFDAKQNGVIEFSEFVRALSVLHPSGDLAVSALRRHLSHRFWIGAPPTKVAPVSGALRLPWS